ncbi:unnamed protein product [Cyprideis torosa]|uniref:DNA mismatch repair protein MutS-like N-terminal domain-containing protein n=1 Tax=Cyprideis torosa TaxID=163714 RepID=A0A7R8W4F4_9CRUS|nr:unnamed protein product [Cyprideis torosa]CAG0884132.1 unnamed protein product [Cyprideis torosa]
MNSILNYFSKTPKTDKDSVKTPKSSRDDVKTPKSSRDDVKTPKSSREGVKTPKSSREGVKTPKSNRHNVKTGSDRENTPRGAGKRRIEGASNPKAPKRPRRVVLHDSDLDDEEDAPEDVDDSGEEYKPEGVVESSSDEEDEEMLEDEATTSDEESPQEKAPVVSGGAGPVGGGTVWEHDKLDFLKPANRKDASGRGPDHPDFDPRTLQVPDAFLKNVSPAQAQWWKIKSRMFDTVLFFKVGKFYELYHMDAVIGVEELNLLYMKVRTSASDEMSTEKISRDYFLLMRGFIGFILSQWGDGPFRFPRDFIRSFLIDAPSEGIQGQTFTLTVRTQIHGLTSLHRFSSLLQVARIEQTETPEMMAERCQRMTRPTKFDRVVNREVCRITTPGTRTCGVIEGEVDTEHKFLLALVEQVESGPGSVRELGVSFVDTTVGLIRLGQFSDDRHLSRLRTLLAHYEAAQVVYPRGSLSPQLASVLSSSLGGCLREPLNPRKECPIAEETLKWLAEKKFFTQDENPAEEADKENAPPLPWPPELLEHTSKDVGPSPRPRPGCELALSALGMLGKYLDKCGIGHSILSLKQVSTYRPSDLLVERAPRKGATKTPPHMESGVNLILDDIALRNLEILVNESTGSVEGTLLQQMDRCKTQFGKRSWMTSPFETWKSSSMNRQAPSKEPSFSRWTDARRSSGNGEFG